MWEDVLIYILCGSFVGIVIGGMWYFLGKEGESHWEERFNQEFEDQLAELDRKIARINSPAYKQVVKMKRYKENRK